MINYPNVLVKQINLIRNSLKKGICHSRPAKRENDKLLAQQIKLRIIHENYL